MAGNREKQGAVVITGASTGIGRACALHLDRLGFQVFAGVRRVVDGQALEKEASDRLQPVMLDVTEAGTIAAAVQTVEAAVDRAGLAGLVNNAGIVVAGPLEFLPLDRLRRQFEVNVIGQVAVTQAFLPLLRRGQGRVINMGSISGRVATPLLGPYAASKFALEALTDSLRAELLPWGIQVSIVEPGAVITPIWDKSASAGSEMLRHLSPRAHELYGPAMARGLENARRTGQRGVPAEMVARVVAHALTARRPRTRYLVGQDARIGAILARLLPDRLRDRLIVRQRGLA